MKLQSTEPGVVPAARIDRRELRRLIAGCMVLVVLFGFVVSASMGAGDLDRLYRANFYMDHDHIPATHVVVGGGAAHTCALTTGGGVRCWGYNGYGRLGDGTTNDSLTPVNVMGLTANAISLGGGWGHTCALMSWGGVRCWGANGSGQVGDGTSQNRYTPVNVAYLGSGVAQISVGLWHSCVVTTSGGVKCWGAGENGRLGDGAETVRRTPVDVVGLQSGVAAVAAGGAHTCALLHTGAVKCWGANNLGALGDGTTVHERLAPVDVVGLSAGAVAITAGDSHTCALMLDGSIRCWGYNGNGQLGDGTTSQRNTPVTVQANGKAFIAVATGLGHTCALTERHQVQCWGANGSGQLGDNTTVDHYTPTPVMGITGDVSAIGVGYPVSCARLPGGALKCWGANAYGTVGDGTTTNRLLPTDVSGFSTTLLANYTYGRQGSYFSLTGSLFPASDTAVISANGHILGSVPTDSTGNLAFQLSTDNADNGFYVIQAAVNPRATTYLVIDPAAPLHPPGSAGSLINLPAEIALTNFVFLPVVVR